MSNRNRNRMPTGVVVERGTIPAFDDQEQEQEQEQVQPAEDKTERQDPEPKAEPAPAQLSVRQQLQAKREAREAMLAERKRKSEEAKEAQELADLTALEDAEREYGHDRVKLVKTSRGGVIVKAPDAVKFNKFQDKAKPRTTDFTELLYPCAVYPATPTPADFLDQLLKAYPAELAKLCTAVCQLAGMANQEVEGE